MQETEYKLPTMRPFASSPAGGGGGRFVPTTTSGQAVSNGGGGTEEPQQLCDDILSCILALDQVIAEFDDPLSSLNNPDNNGTSFISSSGASPSTINNVATTSTLSPHPQPSPKSSRQSAPSPVSPLKNNFLQQPADKLVIPIQSWNCRQSSSSSPRYRQQQHIIIPKPHQLPSSQQRQSAQQHPLPLLQQSRHPPMESYNDFEPDSLGCFEPEAFQCQNVSTSKPVPVLPKSASMTDARGGSGQTNGGGSFPKVKLKKARSNEFRSVKLQAAFQLPEEEEHWQFPAGKNLPRSLAKTRKTCIAEEEDPVEDSVNEVPDARFTNGGSADSPTPSTKASYIPVAKPRRQLSASESAAAEVTSRRSPLSPPLSASTPRHFITSTQVDSNKFGYKPVLLNHSSEDDGYLSMVNRTEDGRIGGGGLWPEEMIENEIFSEEELARIGGPPKSPVDISFVQVDGKRRALGSEKTDYFSDDSLEDSAEHIIEEKEMVTKSPDSKPPAAVKFEVVFEDKPKRKEVAGVAQVPKKSKKVVQCPTFTLDKPKSRPGCAFFVPMDGEEDQKVAQTEVTKPDQDQQPPQYITFEIDIGSSSKSTAPPMSPRPFEHFKKSPSGSTDRSSSSLRTKTVEPKNAIVNNGISCGPGPKVTTPTTIDPIDQFAQQLVTHIEQYGIQEAAARKSHAIINSNKNSSPLLHRSSSNDKIKNTNYNDNNITNIVIEPIETSSSSPPNNNTSNSVSGEDSSTAILTTPVNSEQPQEIVKMEPENYQQVVIMVQSVDEDAEPNSNVLNLIQGNSSNQLFFDSQDGLPSLNVDASFEDDEDDDDQDDKINGNQILELQVAFKKAPADPAFSPTSSSTEATVNSSEESVRSHDDQPEVLTPEAVDSIDDIESLETFESLSQVHSSEVVIEASESTTSSAGDQEGLPGQDFEEPPTPTEDTQDLPECDQTHLDNMLGEEVSLPETMLETKLEVPELGAKNENVEEEDDMDDAASDLSTTPPKFIPEPPPSFRRKPRDGSTTSSVNSKNGSAQRVDRIRLNNNGGSSTSWMRNMDVMSASVPNGMLPVTDNDLPWTKAERNSRSSEDLIDAVERELTSKTGLGSRPMVSTLPLNSRNPVTQEHQRTSSFKPFRNIFSKLKKSKSRKSTLHLNDDKCSTVSSSNLAGSIISGLNEEDLLEANGNGGGATTASALDINNSQHFRVGSTKRSRSSADNTKKPSIFARLFGRKAK